jgi:hypothetical protein
MKPTVVGLVIAGLYILFKLVLFFAGVQYDVMFGKTAMVLIALTMFGIFYSINYYIRSSDTYDWMAAFKKGITVSLFASVVTGIFLYIYYKTIDPFYLEQLSINEYNRMKTVIKPEQMDDFNKSLKSRYTASLFGTITTALVNIIGLISSLIVGILGRMTVKRKAS